MNYKTKKEFKIFAGYLTAFIAALAFFGAIVYSCTAGLIVTDKGFSSTAASTVLILLSVVLLISEYILFGCKDSKKMIAARFLIHNIFGLAGMFIWYGIYKSFGEQYLFTADAVLKEIMVKKFVPYVMIACFAAAVCLLLSGDKNDRSKKR